MSPADSDLLRQMVRQVLREIVPETMAALPSVPAAMETVSIASDADLASFAMRVATASDAERASIAAGTRVFHLAIHPSGAAGSSAAPTAAGSGAAVVHIESGPVTERHVRNAASSQSRIVLGRRAVLTPLARDRARAAGVEITRER